MNKDTPTEIPDQTNQERQSEQMAAMIGIMSEYLTENQISEAGARWKDLCRARGWSAGGTPT